MILAAVVIGKDGDFIITPGLTVGLTAALLVVHGLLNSIPTRWLANLTSSFVFVNVGATIIIIITLLACTGKDQMHPAEYVFGSAGVINQTGGWPDGLAYMLGLLSVQWTMTDYDATAHISEEVRRAAYAATSAIVIAVIGTGLIGWLLNIALVLCSGPLEDLPGPSGLSFLQIMVLRMGKTGALVLWVPVLATAFFVVQTALQATSRTIFAFSRDRGLPDGKYFSKVTALTSTPLPSVWISTFLCVLPPLLGLASPIASTAIFALTTFALDLSYIIPIACRRIFANHPEVHFVPGPFYLGDGILGWAMNLTCIGWTLFVCIILSLPTVLPTTATTMNYCVVLVAGVMALSGLWYAVRARHTYVGPVRASRTKNPTTRVGSTDSIKKD
jgi:amino acid transporter